MLSWSNTKFKLTLGAGTLAVTGMLSELWWDVLPVWVALGIALLPLVVFVFVHPGELPARLVRIAHIPTSGVPHLPSSCPRERFRSLDPFNNVAIIQVAFNVSALVTTSILNIQTQYPRWEAQES